MSQTVLNFDFPKELAAANWEKLFQDMPQPDDFNESERVSVNYTLDASQLPQLLDGLRTSTARLNAIMSVAQSSDDVKIALNEDGMIHLVATLNVIAYELAVANRHLLNCLFKTSCPQVRQLRRDHNSLTAGEGFL